MQRIIDAVNSDLFDVLADVAYALPAVSERGVTVLNRLSAGFA